MHQSGILMDISSKDKTIKLFTYGQYQTKVENDVYYNWSDYFINGSLVERSTDYGNKFGRVNRIGLGKSFLGNTFERSLSNHFEDSKYKSFAKDELKDFSDIVSVNSINNTTHPYFEYGIDGMSMVSKVGEISGLTQKTVHGVSEGTINNVAHLSNVNYYNLPNGVAEWYNLVDRALRVVGQFLLPVSVIKELDITKPVYVDKLGGFYIVEEISEYIDSKTVVNVKLIKLIENLKEG